MSKALTATILVIVIVGVAVVSIRNLATHNSNPKTEPITDTTVPEAIPERRGGNCYKKSAGDVIG